MLSHFSHDQFFVTSWTVACQNPLSMGFSRQEYWSGLPFLPPQALPNPRTGPASRVAPALQADSLLLSHQENESPNTLGLTDSQSFESLTF